jgi:hypothetical protein
VSDANSVAQAIFEGCGANLGPLICTELEPGPVSIETRSDPPEGELAVLPISCEVEDEPLPMLSLASPVNQIAGLARRMLNDDEPDKERDLSQEDLDAMGEVFNLMSGALDQVIRESVNPTLRMQPLPWWRTTEPGDNQFDEGEFLLATGSLGIPDGPTVQLFFRFPPQLLTESTQVESAAGGGQVLLLGLEEQLQQSLRPLLESAHMQVEVVDPDADETEESHRQGDTIILAGDGDDAFERCRLLRLGNTTWTSTLILCMTEPTRSRVVRAIQCGASHVLRVPTDETTLLSVLNRVKSEN